MDFLNGHTITFPKNKHTYKIIIPYVLKVSSGWWHNIKAVL